MVSVTYSTADGTAHSGADYTPASGGVSAWNDGDTATKYISINIPTTATGETSFTITLGNPVGGAVIGSQKTTSVTILNNIKYSTPGILFITFNPLSTGSGYVTITPPGTVCNTDCQVPFETLTPVTLTPTAAQYSLFAGWSGAGCNGTGDCNVTVSGDTTVQATFNLDSEHKVYIPGTTKYYSTLQAAYEAALGGATIKAWSMQYDENLNCNQGKIVILKGGYNQGYSSNNDFTTLNGKLTIRNGTLRVDHLVIK